MEDPSHRPFQYGETRQERMQAVRGDSGSGRVCFSRLDPSRARNTT